MNKTAAELPAVPRIVRTSCGQGPYVVESVTVVDRPWARSTSFPLVASGTRIVTDHRFRCQASALRRRDEILAGLDDFAAEHVTRVTVWQMRDNASPRLVRRAVERAARPTSAVSLAGGRVTRCDRALCRVSLAVASDRRRPDALTSRNVRNMAADWTAEVFTTLTGAQAAAAVSAALAQLAA